MLENGSKRLCQNIIVVNCHKIKITNLTNITPVSEGTPSVVFIMMFIVSWKTLKKCPCGLEMTITVIDDKANQVIKSYIPK